MSPNTVNSLDDFIFEDFKLKLTNLSDQYTRLWQRLGFFLALETAIFGYYGSLVSKDPPSNVLWPTCVMGIALSLIWYVVAAQDRWLVVRYRDRVDKSAKKIGEMLGISDYESEHPGAGTSSGFEHCGCWYYRRISVTTLPVWTSGALVFVWVLVLVLLPSILPKDSENSIEHRNQLLRSHVSLEVSVSISLDH